MLLVEVSDMVEGEGDRRDRPDVNVNAPRTVFRAAAPNASILRSQIAFCSLILSVSLH